MNITQDQWLQFSKYVEERLLKEEKFSMDDADWRTTFGYEMPSYSSIIEFGTKQKPEFYMESDFRDTRCFSCSRKPAAKIGNTK